MSLPPVHWTLKNCHKLLDIKAEAMQCHVLTHMQPLGLLCQVTLLDLHPPLQIVDYRGKKTNNTR